MKRIVFLVLLMALIVVFMAPVAAFADSTANEDHANANGACFGNEASAYASTEKSNSTGVSVSGTTKSAPGARAASVAGESGDCPRNL